MICPVTACTCSRFSTLPWNVTGSPTVIAYGPCRYQEPNSCFPN
jgi:hypothetical protein